MIPNVHWFSSFSVSFQELELGTVNLVAADPIDACHSVDNGKALWGSIALVERGWVSADLTNLLDRVDSLHLTSVYMFSTLFSINFLRRWQWECVW